MDLKLESGDGLLLATATGQVSLRETVEVGKTICDAAAERGLGKILLDCLAAEGELSFTERYILGNTIVDYCAIRSMTPKLAVIGKPPTITGFVAEVASNRGLPVGTFSERQAGLDWLNKFGSKTAGS
jgi:hypothetical protein